MFTGKPFALNTSNLGKQKEFKELFNKYGWDLTFSSLELNEIEATPLEVIVHKASCMPDHVIVEDTSLEVVGALVGIHIKYLLANLDQHIGKQATWNVFLAFKEGQTVYVFHGKVDGVLVPKRGVKGFGFDPYFLPNGSSHTLAELKSEAFNARALAVSSLMRRDLFYKGPLILDWKGPWQNS